MSPFRIVGVVLSVATFLAGAPSDQLPLRDICEVMKHSQKYDGKEVRVVGFVEAEHHSTALSGPCGKGVYVSYDSRGAPGLEAKIAARRVGSERRPLRAILVGRYRFCGVKTEVGCFRQIKVDRFECAEFLRDDGSFGNCSERPPNAK